MICLHSFGTEEPHPELVALMLSKISAYHFSAGAELKYGRINNYRHIDEWFIQDKSDTPSWSHGVEGCQGLLEGVREGWHLHKKLFPEPVPKVAAKRVRKSTQEQS